MSYPTATLRYFANSTAAREYRHEFGTGGWIFVDTAGAAVLFPPDFLPARIFNHPAVKGLSGQLIGSQ